jgi:hypothetical protein
MGTSFVKYQGRGFWSWDGYLEHVLALLADQIGDSTDQTWLVELRDHWRSQSSGIFGGWIHPQLDEFLTDDKRREVVLGMLNRIILTPGLSREARETAQLFEALLRGQLHTDASSKLDYMVSGSHPYEWSLRNQSKIRDRSEESTE